MYDFVVTAKAYKYPVTQGVIKEKALLFQSVLHSEDESEKEQKALLAHSVARMGDKFRKATHLLTSFITWQSG